MPLDHPVHGNTAGWDWRTGPGGDIWRFEAPKTTSYLFDVGASMEHQPSIELFAITARGHETLGRTSDMLHVPLNAGTYYVNVDDNRVDRGPYVLKVVLHEHSHAPVRIEDVNVVEPLCTRAVPLALTPALGTFQSLPGGARARCGGTGGDVVHVLDVAAPARVSLRAAAQFEFALELRRTCMQGKETTACALSRDYEGDLSVLVEPGRYFVVLDSAQVGSLRTGLPGAAMRGAYSLEAHVEAQAGEAAR